MRIGALLLELLVAIATAGAVAWWAATIGMRLLGRWLERFRPLRGGPLVECAAVLLLCAAVLSAIAAWLGRTLFKLLSTAPDWVSGFWAATWWWLVAAAMWMLAGAGIWAAFREAMVALGRARRRWYLTALGQPAPSSADVDPRPADSPGRRIVIFCDGTSNRPDEMEAGTAAPTNVWKLYNGLVYDETQVTWYQPGVGSDSSSTAAEVRRTGSVLKAVGANPGSQGFALADRVLKLVESAFGTGISEGIIDGYTEIVRQYRPGDRIYLVGFSRGAYTARCIAGVISRCGLLRSENIRYAAEMVQLYRNRASPDDRVAIRPELIHADPAIEFVGVFDTVASLGVPLWGWWFRASPIWKLKPLTTDPVDACRNVYHALAMDERRSQFIPTLYDNPLITHGPTGKLERLEQVWFRGAHADVGGGYARHDLSDIPLDWMMNAMTDHGLRFKGGVRKALQPNPLGFLHDELSRRPDWVLFGSWPRWHPVPGSVPDLNGTTLHASVLERAEAVQRQIGRPDLLRLQPGESRSFVAEAQRDWNRTGLIIDHSATYRLTYRGGYWRDSEAELCGPAGQEARGLFDQRRWLEVGRRLRYQPWMQLVATVAHPRSWPPEEKGFFDLVKLLFKNDPVELTRQLAPIGQDLAEPGMSILIRNDAPSGLLHLFANDWYQTASNNSGGLDLSLTRVAGEQPGLPLWTFNADGGWNRTDP